MMKNRVLIMISGFAILLVILVQLAKFFTTSTLIIAIEPSITPVGTYVTVGDDKIAPKGGEHRYVTKVGRGTHAISVASAGFQPFEVSVETGFRSTKTVSVRLEQLRAETLADRLAADIEGITVLEPRFFGENDWVAFFTQPDGGQADRLMVIGRFLSGRWEIIDEGTGIDERAAMYDDAPSELKTYIREARS